MSSLVNFRWQPTTARVVAVDCCGQLPRGSLQTTPATLTWPVKDPGDTLDYVVDYSLILAGDCGDAIATLDVSVVPNGPGDLISTSVDAEGNQAVLWLAGGQAGTTYSVTIGVTTNNGRSILRTIYLPVVALSVPAVVGPSLTDQMGAAITDQTGASITV